MLRRKAIEKEWILRSSIENLIMKEIKELSTRQASGLVALINDGCESAYIARYREDVHGGLPPDKIRKVMESYHDAVQLNEKVSKALTTVTVKVVGINQKRSVEERLKNCEDFDELADVTKEFAAGTRKSKANIARELGLEPHAQAILDGKPVDFRGLISNKMKTVRDVQEHTKICLADLINRDTEVRKIAQKIVKLETACNFTVSSVLTTEASKNKEKLREKLEHYKDYIACSSEKAPKTWDAKKIKDFQVSALQRGAEERILTWKVSCGSNNINKLHPFSPRKVSTEMIHFFREALGYSIMVYFIPMLERGVRRHLIKNAINRSINIFGENVEQLFKQEGIRSRYVIALDPGWIVKTAFLNPSGQVIGMDQFQIHESRFDKKGFDLLKKWSTETNGMDIVFAIGNGKNTYNTQSAVSHMIESNQFCKGIDVGFCVVPEHGASKYSCTPAALEEFGADAEIKQISAVSIGRRLIDPMSEYVKIEPQHLGKGQYQLSVDSKMLSQRMTAVIRDRVSLIGADMNTASKHLLKNICGLNQKISGEIVKYREEHGCFRSRTELKRVKGIGSVTFQQCAGFLKVRRPEELEGPPSKKRKRSSDDCEWNPLDVTMVHPDDYETADRLLHKLNMAVDEVSSKTSIPLLNLTEEELKIVKLLQKKPDLNPAPPIMKKNLSIRSLREGEKYTGVVSNKASHQLLQQLIEFYICDKQ